MDFKNSFFATFKIKINIMSFLLLSAVVSAKFKVNKNKQNNQKICEKILIDWREILTKIVVPNQFPGLLFYVDKLARVLATCVKNLQMMYSSVSCVIEFLHGWSKFRLWNFKFRHPKLVRHNS